MRTGPKAGAVRWVAAGGAAGCLLAAGWAGGSEARAQEGQAGAPPVTLEVARDQGVEPADGGARSDAPFGPVGGFISADALLDALEHADKGIATLQAGIQYSRDAGELEGGERQIRRGALFFRSAPRRSFSVSFTDLFVGQVRRDEVREFVFDGEWFVERIPGQKQMFKRRVVGPGDDAVDPLAIGGGPFPIPIGQKKSSILDRFHVALLPPEAGWSEGTAPAMLNGTLQLRLIPRAGRDEARDFREIRIWYRQQDLLPRMARTVNVDGSKAEVQLINLKKNEPVPQGAFDVEHADEGWQVEVQDLRRGDGANR